MYLNPDLTKDDRFISEPVPAHGVGHAADHGRLH
jgi:hypothetical protein